MEIGGRERKTVEVWGNIPGGAEGIIQILNLSQRCIKHDLTRGAHNKIIPVPN
jgi:hypothetical protein